MTNQFYSNGKLLITGEYSILDGANGLAIPTKTGQTLNIKEIDASLINWTSLDHKGDVWYKFSIPLEVFSSDNLLNEQFNYFKNIGDTVGLLLLQILIEAKILNPDFLKTERGFEVTTSLTFPRNWGLGSSSTLINNIALWSQVNPYILLNKTLGGSGYDIACASNDFPITYQLTDTLPIVKRVRFDPNFKETLFFIYLNKKQNSRDGIKDYRKSVKDKNKLVSKISSLTDRFIKCQELENFKVLMQQHEEIIGETLDIKPIKQRLFSDFPGAIKSLGAWGGDFILAAHDGETKEYFKDKGYNTVLTYAEMVL